MNWGDFMAGQMAQRITDRYALNDALNDADNALASWQRYATNLERMNDQNEAAFVKSEAGRIAFAHLFRRLAEELRRHDPNNGFLRRDVQLQIIRQKVAESAAAMGYTYDPSTDAVTKSR